MVNSSLIILAGGKGLRFGKDKLLEIIGNYPVIIHSILNFIKEIPNNNLIVVCNENKFNQYKNIINKFIPKNSIHFIIGGNNRMQSVFNGLKKIKIDFNNIKNVIIHDAARPLVSKILLKKCIDNYIKLGNTIPVNKIYETVKMIDINMKVLKTINKNNLRISQTPQIFCFEELYKSYNAIINSKLKFTDDAAILEHLNYTVNIIENDDINIKITYPNDIKYIQFLLK